MCFEAVLVHQVPICAVAAVRNCHSASTTSSVYHVCGLWEQGRFAATQHLQRSEYGDGFYMCFAETVLVVYMLSAEHAAQLALKRQQLTELTA